jgi:hypothetical protein
MPAETLETYLCTFMITTELTIEATDWDAAYWKATRLAQAAASDMTAIGDVTSVELNECADA